MIIAEGVYKIPSQPNGPDREINKYTINPTTTGGKPIIALNIISTISLPQKFLIAKYVPMGKPTKQDKSNDRQLTFIESKSILKKSLSKVKTKPNACVNDSNIIHNFLDYLCFNMLIYVKFT